MAFWLMFFLWVGFTVLGELLRPKPKFGAPSPSGVGDFTVPTAQAGRPIPAIFGTVKMRGPNVVWYGDLVSAAITEKVKTGLFSSQTITKGYKYYLGQQVVLCHGPIDEFQEIRFDDRTVPSGKVTIYATNLGLYQRRNDSITFGNGPPPWFTAFIPAGDYTNLTTLAQAAQAAMQAAIGTSTWRVVYGYEVQPGISDEIHYAVRVTGGSAVNRIATLVPGVYNTGALFAGAVALALNTKEATEAGGARVSFACIYDGQKFTITATLLRPGFDAWKVNGVSANYGALAAVLIGKQMGSDETIIDFPSSWTSDYPTSPKRFHFGFAGLAGKLHLDPLEPNGPFKSAAVFGLMRNGDVTITQKMGDQDKVLPGLAVFDSTDKTTVVVNAPTLFGGDDREGGIVGTFEIYKGTQTQTANDYLQSLLGLLPSYLGICYAVARKPYVGTTPYIKPISFVLRRCPNGLALTGGKQNISGDANPAAAVYDILTNATWGCGIPASLVDAPSFVDASETLYREGMGVSMIFDGQSQASELIGEVLRHVDGVVFADPATGKLRIKLARPDYNLMDLPRFDQSSVDAVKMARPSWDETKNIVKINYTDRSLNFTERVAQAMDLANIQARGGEIAEDEFPFRGLSSGAAAQRTAARVLRAVSYPLAILELDVNRRAWWLRPGGVFRLTWDPLGIADMACRVTRIRLGDPRSGRIMVDAVEDVFGIAWTAYTAPASEWVDPIQPVGDLADSRLIEVPYAMVVGPDRLAVAVVATGLPVATGYQIWSDVDAHNYALTNQGQVTPSGILAGGPASGGLGYTETTIRVTPGPLMPQDPPSSPEFRAGGAVMLIDNELIAWEFMGINSDGSYTFSGLVRGVMDTTPVPHAAESRVWFVSEGAVLVREDPYIADGTVFARILPYNSLGVRDIADGDEKSLILASRATRPYVPRDFRCNTVLYPAQISGALAMTWGHRNRLGNWSFADAGATVSPETSTTYTIRLYDELDILRRTFSGLTGTSQTWTAEQADSGLPVGTLNSRVRIEVEAVVAGLVSHQIINFTVWRTVVSDSMFPMDVVRRQGWRRRKRARRRAAGLAMGSGE